MPDLMLGFAMLNPTYRASLGRNYDRRPHAISEKAAQLRAKHGLKTPDALQLATVIIHRADYSLTNDPNLKKVKEAKALVVDDYLPRI
jgi:predicted nucleic acid-binding protein